MSDNELAELARRQDVIDRYIRYLDRRTLRGMGWVAWVVWKLTGWDVGTVVE